MNIDPEFLTLGQAARTCNRSKATISRAVRSGRLPAKAAADNAGGWLIRRDDLDRVFPQQAGEAVAKPSRSTPRDDAVAADTYRETERLRIEVEGLRERLHGAEQRLSDAMTTITDLRAERDRLLGVIERQAPQPELRRGWWRRLIGR